MSELTSRPSRLPRRLYRAQDVQRLDQIAIKRHGIDGFKLMQRAGQVVFTAVLEHWPQTRLIRVFAGSGNNAGDGYVVARLAHEHGLQCEVICIGDPQRLQGDAAKAHQWAAEADISMVSLEQFLTGNDSASSTTTNHTIIIDALLGTGLDRPVSGAYADAIAIINEGTVPVVAVDIPSGLSADTGCPLGAAVLADLTVTFIGLKQGLLTGQGRDFVGAIIFSNLDVPDEIYIPPDAPVATALRIDINDATRHLAPRALSSHKAMHGHVLVLGGESGYGGAALLAAEAALRTGAGLVSVVTRSVHRPALLARRPELMVVGTEDAHSADQLANLLQKASVIVVGPGLGTGDWSRQLLLQALAAQTQQQTPLVIDADGLRLLAEKPAASTRVKRDNWILTPHPGEAAQLLQCSTQEVQADRFAAVRALQSKWGGNCLLKGSGSLLCSPQAEAPILLSTEGNPGMATAGMGDVLSGIIGSLVAQGLTLADSLKCGVVIHGEAADLAVEQTGPRGLVASDLFAYIQRLVNPA